VGRDLLHVVASRFMLKHQRRVAGDALTARTTSSFITPRVQSNTCCD
jgi:hypothetical protein